MEVTLRCDSVSEFGMFCAMVAGKNPAPATIQNVTVIQKEKPVQEERANAPEAAEVKQSKKRAEAAKPTEDKAAEPMPKPESAPWKDDVITQAQAPAPAPAKPDEDLFQKTRSYLAAMTKTGKRDKVVEALTYVGAAKLPDLKDNPEKLQQLYDKAVELNA